MADDPDDDATGNLPAEQRQRFIEILRQHGTDNPEQVLAQLNQYFVHVSQRDSEFEGLVRAARQMNEADPGTGKRFLEAVVADYERQSRLQEREQDYLDRAQKAQHRISFAGLGVASLIAFAVVGGAVYCALTGDPISAGVLITGAAAMMVVGFLRVRANR